MCNLYKHTFTKACVSLQEEKIKLSTGFLFLCACFSPSESQNMTQNCSRVHRRMVNREPLLFWGGCCSTRVFSAESWSATMWLHRALSRYARQGGCCWEETQKRGFRAHSGAVLSWCALLQQGRAVAASAPARLSSASTPSPASHTQIRRHRGQYRNSKQSDGNNFP